LGDEIRKYYNRNKNCDVNKFKNDLKVALAALMYRNQMNSNIFTNEDLKMADHIYSTLYSYTCEKLNILSSDSLAFKILFQVFSKHFRKDFIQM
jgi:hypothetical protein